MTASDGIDPRASTDAPTEAALAAHDVAVTDSIVTCDACPVLCRIRPGKTGACDRYGNVEGKLARLDPIVVTQRTLDADGKLVPFLESAWDGKLLPGADTFVTGIGAGTTYPDYKPAPFIVSASAEGVDMVTVVTEGDLQLLRRQGEDRHRPLCRAGAGGDPRQGRAGRPRHDGRVRLADAVDRRRASSDRRLASARAMSPARRC